MNVGCSVGCTKRATECQIHRPKIRRAFFELTIGKFGSVAINVGTAVILAGDTVGNCAAVRFMLVVSRQATRFPNISLILQLKYSLTANQIVKFGRCTIQNVFQLPQACCEK